MVALGDAPTYLSEETPMRECTIADLAAAHASGAHVLDVREPVEYVEGHVPGAVLVPMAQLSSRLTEIPKDGTLYVVCRSGNRSKASSELLSRAGYDAVSVAGGTVGWIQAGHPIVTGTARA
jgi:rhodanese-related sulfurtransferase